MSVDSNNTTRGYLLLLIPILGWGFAPNIVEIGLGYIDALPFLTYRFLTAALLLTPFVLYYKREQVVLLARNKWTWVIGISQTWAVVFQYLSQLYVVPSLSAIISYSYMIIVPVVSMIVLQERLQRIHLPVVIIASLGLVLIASTSGYNINDSSFLGLFLAFLSMWGFAFYITSTSRLTSRSGIEVDSIALFYIIMVIVSVAGLVLSLIFHADFSVSSPNAWISILLLMLISTVIAYIAYIESLKYISANTASVLMLLQIIIPFIIDSTVYHRSFGIRVLFGSFLILLSSYLAVRFHKH